MDKFRPRAREIVTVARLLLEEEGLENLRRLMDAGCYGRLESIIDPERRAVA